MNQALSFLGRVLRRRAVLFLISDWFADSFERPLNLLTRRHELVTIEVEDPLEESIPERGLLHLRIWRPAPPAWWTWEYRRPGESGGRSRPDASVPSERRFFARARSGSA